MYSAQSLKEKISSTPSCNFCNTLLKHRFIDIVMPMPIGEYTVENYQQFRQSYICEHCFLVQFENPPCYTKMDSEFITSYSPAWLQSMHEYATAVFEKIELTSKGYVIELINHNQVLRQDHSQLKYTLTKKDVYSFVEMYGKGDEIICHNEMAYVGDVKDFVGALKLLLTPGGTIILEFPNLLALMEGTQEVYHTKDTLRYFSFTSVDIILRHHKLVIYDTEECLPKGCIRLYVKHMENLTKQISKSTPAMRGRERDYGMSYLNHYMSFKNKLERQLLLHDSL